MISSAWYRVRRVFKNQTEAGVIVVRKKKREVTGIFAFAQGIRFTIQSQRAVRLKGSVKME